MADWWDSGNFSLGDSGGGNNWWDTGGFSLDNNYSTPALSPSNFSLGSNTSMQNYGAPISQPQGGAGSMWGDLGKVMSNPGTIFGGLGGIAGLIGQLISGGQGASQTPKMTTAQKAQFEAAQRAQGGMAGFGAGNTPLQQDQAALLHAITQGQGLNQGYAQSIEQAFAPQMGSLYNQAAEAGQRRGFYDAPATSPAGGAVLGPGLADLQGQIAQAKIAMMMGLPGLFQQPINTQLQGASNYASGMNNLFNAYPTGTQQQMPLGASIGQGVGNSLVGIGQSLGQQQQQESQKTFQNQLLQMMSQQQRSPYEFGGYSGQ